MKAKVIFRLAAPVDAGQLKELNDLFNGDDCNSLESIAVSLGENQQEIVCVAQLGEQLIGFCCGQVFLSMCYDVNYGEITELFVREEHRRSGVGKGLMAYMEGELVKRGIQGFQLFTGKENHGAQGFYRGCGYWEANEMMFRKRLHSQPGCV